jgi:hypothetical protein
MSPDSRTQGCEKCRSRNTRSEALEQVERRTLNGKTSGVETRFRCKYCDTEWVVIEKRTSVFRAVAVLFGRLFRGVVGQRRL